MVSCLKGFPRVVGRRWRGFGGVVIGASAGLDCSAFRSALHFGLRVLLPGAEIREQIVNERGMGVESGIPSNGKNIT